MNEQLSKYLEASPHLYPVELERRFPRVLQRIVMVWRDAEAAKTVFDDLLVDLRGDRQGFPPEVAREIFLLSFEHQKLLALPLPDEDVWVREREVAAASLQELGLQPHATDMLRAAEAGEPERLLLFLRAGLPVDARDAKEWTPLMVAAFHGNEAAARLLIEYGANPRARDRDGYTPLHWGALAGYAEVVALIGRRVDVNVQSDAGMTALLQGSAAGHVDVARVLVEAGADANIASAEGWTPLHKAVANGHAHVARLLVACGASVSARHQSGATPLSLAKSGQDRDILTMLIEAQYEKHGLSVR